jgi:predicted NBD/HSP70 family sugar kinase
MTKRHSRAASTDAHPHRVVSIRGLNLERLLVLAMEATGSFTRAELMEATGLTAPTVGSLTEDLIKGGLIIDLGTGPSRGGRRPSLMEFNARHGVAAAVALGAAQTQVAIADLRGAVIDRVTMPTDVDCPPAQFLAEVAATVQTLMRRANVPKTRLLAVGIGVPGAVDPDQGVIVGVVPNLPGWSEVPVAEMLRRGLDAPILVGNDVNLAILGERWRGAARGHATCAFITVGTGIGAGIIVNGELHKGHHFLAGEIALMCMGPEYVGRDFGARGCFETLAGLKAIAVRWESAAADHRPAGGASSSRGDGWIETLFAASAAGDPHARAIVEDTARLISIATANLSVVIDPSLIVLGGTLIARAPILIDEVARIVRGIVPNPPRIVPSDLHEEAPLLGSLLVGIREAKARLRQQARSGTIRPARQMKPRRPEKAARPLPQSGLTGSV